MTEFLNYTEVSAKSWMHDIGFTVEIREKEDMIELKIDDTKVAEIVYLSDPNVCYFITPILEEADCCTMEENVMVMTWGIATLMVWKEANAIHFSIEVVDLP